MHRLVLHRARCVEPARANKRGVAEIHVPNSAAEGTDWHLVRDERELSDWAISRVARSTRRSAHRGHSNADDGDHAAAWLPIARKEMKRSMSTEVTSTGYARAGILGVTAGLRSQLPIALLSIAANRGAFAASAPAPLGLLRSRAALVALVPAAVELGVDKLPAIPPRTKPASLAFRVAIGAIVGGAVSHEARSPLVACALLGGVSAAAGSFAGASYRRVTTEATGYPDLAFAIVEDAAAIGLGAFALRSLPSSLRR